MKRLIALAAIALLVIVAISISSATSPPPRHVAVSHPAHAIGTAVLRYNWRGGHATAPKKQALR